MLLKYPTERSKVSYIDFAPIRDNTLVCVPFALNYANTIELNRIRA
jgi:hypothetical protein